MVPSSWVPWPLTTKQKFVRYDKKVKDDIQTTKNRVDVAEKRSRELNLENLKLMEQMSLSEAKAIDHERGMTVIKEELTTLKAFYKSQLEFFRAAH